jgi:hypothetical protein
MPSNRLLAWTQRFAALAIVAFWVSFWMDHSDLPAAIVDMEWSFLIPDLAWIVVALWIASHWVMRGDRRAAVATAVAGGSLAYLGLLDAASNLRHHQYSGSFSRGALNAAVNLACVGFGCASICIALRHSQSER